MSVKIVQNNKKSDAPTDVNANLAAIAGNRLVGFIPSTGLFKSEFNIGDLLAIANGALIGDALAREGNSLEVYNAAGALQSSILWEDLASAANLTGFIVPFAGDSVPSGFFECDGSVISRTTFAPLFTAIGTRYGIGDGSTTFAIPDLRGEFIRGFDNGAGNDPDAGSRTDSGDGTTGDNVGTKQADEFRSHVHPTSKSSESNNFGDLPWAANNDDVELIDTNAAGGNETRPRNVNMMYCIKF